jgi:threonine dehydrogenase-like Zn-dependent dehydrogenase
MASTGRWLATPGSRSDASTIFRINLSFERAALTEPCCVGYNAVIEKSNIRPGDTVVVLGPGPIGLLCAEMARLAGAGTLIVAGMAQDQSRLRRRP